MVFISKVNNYMFRPKAAIIYHKPTTSPQPNVRTIDTTPISRSPINYPPTPNTYPTKEIHTPPFIDPLDIPLDKVTCSTYYNDEISTSLCNIDIYMTLFEQNCNCDILKMAALGRNM